MDELFAFCSSIKKQLANKNRIEISDAREIIKSINTFLYTNYEGIGTTQALGKTYEYLSDFHKYWESHHKEILDCQIDKKKCELVAEALHNIYIITNGNAFRHIYETCGLKHQDICRVRLFTANQDFRGSRDFASFAKVYENDNSLFDEENIHNDPEAFLKSINVNHLSQTDKRIKYAKKIADFILDHECTPFEIIQKYDNNIFELRNALINCEGAGYGNKKTDMFLRDMVVLGVWKGTKGFEKIDVASDINTIKVALRTGILRTAIPLVSSFLDIFCHQYSYIDKMNALAWRKVWEIWSIKYPTETISSPCMMDYFVYQVIGKQFCKQKLSIFQCDSENHTFKWHTSQNRTCQYCYQHGKKGIRAHLIKNVMPCSDPDGTIYFRKTDFVKSLPPKQVIETCPFINICGNNRYLMPPKSISICGQTGWESAYARSTDGGGGLMA